MWFLFCSTIFEFSISFFINLFKFWLVGSISKKTSLPLTSFLFSFFFVLGVGYPRLEELKTDDIVDSRRLSYLVLRLIFTGGKVPCSAWGLLEAGLIGFVFDPCLPFVLLFDFGCDWAGFLMQICFLLSFWNRYSGRSIYISRWGWAVNLLSVEMPFLSLLYDILGVKPISLFGANNECLLT